MTFPSSFCFSEPESSVQTFDRNKSDNVSVKAPSCILEYNKHMGDVDEINSYPSHCSSRAFVKIFLTILKTIATNCWLELNRDCELQKIHTKTRLYLFSFKAMIAESLCKVHVGTKIACSSGNPSFQKRPNPGPRPKISSDEVRLDGLAHWPIRNGSENRGSNCRIPGCNAKPVTKCDAILFIFARDCFKAFHTVKNISKIT